MEARALLGSLETLEEGGGAWSAAANAPVSCGPPGVASMVLNVDVDTREASPRVSTRAKRGSGGVLPSCGRHTCHGQRHCQCQVCWRG